MSFEIDTDIPGYGRVIARTRRSVVIGKEDGTVKWWDRETLRLTLEARASLDELRSASVVRSVFDDIGGDIDEEPEEEGGV